MKLLAHLRLQFSHLNKHKSRRGFSDTINPICACKTEVEATEHFLLSCHFCSTQRLELFENLVEVDPSLSAKYKVYILLVGSQTNNSNGLSHEILKNVISYLKTTTHFDEPLINF